MKICSFLNVIPVRITFSYIRISSAFGDITEPHQHFREQEYYSSLPKYRMDFLEQNTIF